ncbi:inositol monophosphatase family protein [Pseudohalocynthiibacter sp. F2068]|jgi:myo-inositol-1(or 4)-monophosphatase|uniref:inositol monophosphatase family protein n=1 Tax=Pseudohalocynthiibacter sp. F2068 TaxID=2926418 RepID=UPI001FF34672|nr:inositol monophosphatase family protein [Pseudohalocynthiibacter sp. F2068]MCK0103362.1 inositol monophosphatase [Pseudohalocynthiibacter sp. F2068]
MQGSANLNVMIKAARKAGRSLAKDFREIEHLQTSVKGAGDFARRAVTAVEGFLREDLMNARPSYGWLIKGHAETEGKDPTRRWIVDPLDGAINYLHGLPHFAVSIALEHKGEIVSGVIYDPSKDEVFFAEKGQGAWMNEGRLRVSGRNRLAESTFATGLPASGDSDLPEKLQDLARILPASAGVRNLGAPSLDLAYVAAGRIDGYWERNLDICELSAGIIVVREAGGLIEPLKVEADMRADGEVICANEQLFNLFAKAIRSI